MLPFRIADRELASPEVDIFHPQRQRFEETQARTVEQLQDELRRRRRLADDLAHFVNGEDNRQTLGPLRANDVVDPRQRLLQHVAVEKEKCGERLVLRRGAHRPVDGQVAQKRIHVVRPHRRRMPLAVIQNVTADPHDIGFFRPRTVMADADGVSDSVEEFRRLCHPPRLPRSGGKRKLSTSRGAEPHNALCDPAGNTSRNALCDYPPLRDLFPSAVLPLPTPRSLILPHRDPITDRRCTTPVEAPGAHACLFSDPDAVADAM